MENENTRRHQKRKTKKRKWLKYVLLLLAIVLVAGGIFAYITYKKYNDLVTNLPSETGATATVVEDVKTQPFALMLLGEGSTGDDGESGADSIMVMVVNPENNYAELVGIPRDSYLPRGKSCDSAGYFDKITNSGADISCLETTLESLFDIEINYYVNINFRSFIKIIDTIGGVEMNVPDLREGFENWIGDASDGTYIGRNSELKNGEQWCEADSQRNPYAVCFNAFGPQLLDGEHALAVVRTRHYDGDFSRNDRQMELIKAVAKKITDSTSIFTINNVLSAADGNIKTNISQEQFLDFAKLGKKLVGTDENNQSTFQIRTTQLDGESGTFAGDLGTASYNSVSIESIENIRMKLSRALSPTVQVEIDPSPFYYNPNASEFASKYGRPFLTDSMDISDPETIRQFKYN